VASYLYKLRKVTTNHPTAKGRVTYALTVPTEVAEKLPEGQRFVLEPNDDGLLYRPVEIGTPAWMDKSNA